MIRLTKMKMTTTDSFEGLKIIESIGPVTSNAVIGMNIFKDFLSGITDVLGGESSSYQKALDELTQVALKRLEKKALSFGANGIKGLRIDTGEISGKGKSMVMITAYGTAVLIDTFEETNLDTSRLVFLKTTNILNLYSYDELIDEIKLKRVRKSVNLSFEEFNSMFSEYLTERKNYLKNKHHVDKKFHQEKLSKEAEHLIKDLKHDEMIVKMGKDNELRIIKKSKYELDKELHLTKNYIIVYENSLQ